MLKRYGSRLQEEKKSKYMAPCHCFVCMFDTIGLPIVSFLFD